MSGGANWEAHWAWNGESGQRWAVDADRRDRFTARVGDALLTAARLRRGEVVMDVGCGCGATTLVAAEAVGTGGAAHGIDLSEPMLEVARRRLGQTGLANVTLTLADAQTHDLRPGIHDVVVSRFGTMFFDDPTAAFINLTTALRRGGRLCIATWQPLVANDWLAVPGAVLSSYGTFPDTGAGGPGMFAQSDPEVVRATLQRAGFVAVDIAEVAVTVRLGDDPSDAADYLAGTGPGRAVLDTIAEDERSDALAAVAATLRDHLTDDGVHLGAGILVTTALRP